MAFEIKKIGNHLISDETNIGDGENSVVLNSEENTATGNYSLSEGNFTSAQGEGSHAEGNFTTASGTGAHSEGGGTIASGAGSHAEGSATYASGDYSHSEGSDTIASGKYSHVEGLWNYAAGDCSHAEGESTNATGDYSHTEGCGTIAFSDYSHIEGKFNITDENNIYAHIVGNGIAGSERSNAHTLDWDGNAWYAGTVTAGRNTTDEDDDLVLVSKGYLKAYIETILNSRLGEIESGINTIIDIQNSMLGGDGV